MRPRVFALNATRDFGERVAESLEVALEPHEERSFEDGEHKSRPLTNVRGDDVFVVQSLHADAAQSANDKLVRLLLFIGALQDASAARVTAVVPYLAYARKDQKSKPRDPVSTRYVARLFEAVGTDRIVTADVHNLAAFQNAFRIPTEHLEAKWLFVDHIADLSLPDCLVLSPDVGGVKRAEALRQALEARLGIDVGVGFMQKARSEGVVSGETLVADVEGKNVVIVDDLIASGTTIERAATACQEAHARQILAMATHGLFIGGAAGLVEHPALDSLVVTDTVPPFRLSEPAMAKLTTLSIAALFGRAIECIHTGKSVVELLEGTPSA